MDIEKNRVFDTWAEWHYSEGAAYLILHSHSDPLHWTKVVCLKSKVGNGAAAKCIVEYGSNTITVDCPHLIPLWPKKKDDKVKIVHGNSSDLFCMMAPDMKMTGEAKLPANCSKYVNKTGKLISIDGNSAQVRMDADGLLVTLPRKFLVKVYDQERNEDLVPNVFVTIDGKMICKKVSTPMHVLQARYGSNSKPENWVPPKYGKKTDPENWPPARCGNFSFKK